MCLQMNFFLNHQKLFAFHQCKKIDFVFCFNIGVVSNLLGCVSVEWCVLFFNLCFKVLQLPRELNSRGGLRPRS